MVFLFGEDLLLSCLWIVSGELVSFVDVVLTLEWSGAIGSKIIVGFRRIRIEGFFIFLSLNGLLGDSMEPDEMMSVGS